METTRIFNIILAELSLENLKLQEKLELEINSNSDIDLKVEKIKTYLKAMIDTESMITKFTTLITNKN